MGQYNKCAILVTGLSVLALSANLGCAVNYAARYCMFVNKEYGSYRAIRNWHIRYLSNLRSSGRASEGSKSICVPDAFSYRDASRAFAAGFACGCAKQVSEHNCYMEFLDSCDIISCAYADGIMNGIFSTLNVADGRKWWQVYSLQRAQVDELVSMYWIDPLAVKLTDAEPVLDEISEPRMLTGSGDIDVEYAPAINPYEDLWLSFSNSYVRTVHVLEIIGNEAFPEGHMDAAIMSIEASSIPEYRAYIYGYWQALLDRASSHGRQCSQLQFRLEVLRKNEQRQYAYIKESLKGQVSPQEKTGP